MPEGCSAGLYDALKAEEGHPSDSLLSRLGLHHTWYHTDLSWEQCHQLSTIRSTVNDSDLDSVTLKAYKVKECGRNVGSDNFIWNAQHFFLASSALIGY